MKKILHTLLFMSAIQFTNAQYVAIPDSGFRVWLNNNGYSACMSGNNLDTNCAALASVTILSFYAPSPPINDYTGLQYFKNMLHLAFFQITANKIPLPPNLTYLSIFFDTSLVSIPSLPDSITFLQIENTDITQLPPLPSALWIIYCGDNLLTSLPPLPASLHQLECVDNQITSLPSLPGGLDSLSLQQQPYFRSSSTARCSLGALLQWQYWHYLLSGSIARYGPISVLRHINYLCA